MQLEGGTGPYECSRSNRLDLLKASLNRKDLECFKKLEVDMSLDTAMGVKVTL